MEVLVLNSKVEQGILKKLLKSFVYCITLSLLKEAFTCTISTKVFYMLQKIKVIKIKGDQIGEQTQVLKYVLLNKYLICT